MENNEIHPLVKIHRAACEDCGEYGSDVAPVVVGDTETMLCDTCAVHAESGNN